MEQIITNAYYVFGIGASLIIGLLLALKYVEDRRIEAEDKREVERIAHKEFMDKIADAILVMRTIIEERLP